LIPRIRLAKCSYATYKATDSFNDARRDIEAWKYDRSLSMLEKTIKFLEEVEDRCKISLEETKEQVKMVITEVKAYNWEIALRLIKDAEDDFEHRLLEASVWRLL